MKKITLNILGLGKVGRVFAQVWSRLPEVEITGLYHRRPLSSDEQAQLPTAKVVQHLNQLPPADLWIIAVSDTSILEVATKLSQTTISFQQAVVCHCSGILTAEELLPLQAKGAAIASCHPILTFAAFEQAVTHFTGCYIGLEGDSLAVQRLKPLLIALGTHPLEIPRQAKVLYHLMAVVSGNFVAILLDFAAKCAEKSLIDCKMAMRIVAPLMESTLANAILHSPAEALSGPFSRLDKDSIHKHLDALQQSLPAQEALYKALGKAALQLNPDISLEANGKKEAIYNVLS